MQRALAALGYQLGIQDGIYGERTEAAVQGFQQREKLAGRPGVWTCGAYDEALAKATPFEFTERAGLTATFLKNAGDAQTQRLSLGKRAAVALGGFTTVAQGLQSADVSQLPSFLHESREFAEPVIEAVKWAASSVWIAVTMGCAAIYLLFHKSQNARVDEVREGKATP